MQINIFNFNIHQKKYFYFNFDTTYKILSYEPKTLKFIL